ncbi:hypothetical protein TL16_g11051 [Triparma laevis f. inornata]|uniref:Uncharacterized protein n=1 Tax=Triparma laevis f. inornata TaxID=1714386 RepID=A0A9W7BJC7_9STRA|nr:hypothetical protein TL16_g11051 [Triparma laevis f. inornata]
MEKLEAIQVVAPDENDDENDDGELELEGESTLQTGGYDPNSPPKQKVVMDLQQQQLQQQQQQQQILQHIPQPIPQPSTYTFQKPTKIHLRPSKPHTITLRPNETLTLKTVTGSGKLSMSAGSLATKKVICSKSIIYDSQTFFHTHHINSPNTNRLNSMEHIPAYPGDMMYEFCVEGGDINRGMGLEYVLKSFFGREEMEVEEGKKVVLPALQGARRREGGEGYGGGYGYAGPSYGPSYGYPRSNPRIILILILMGNLILMGILILMDILTLTDTHNHTHT